MAKQKDKTENVNEVTTFSGEGKDISDMDKDELIELLNQQVKGHYHNKGRRPDPVTAIIIEILNR